MLGHAEWPQLSLSNRNRKKSLSRLQASFAAFSPEGMPVVQFQRFNQANGTARSGTFVAGHRQVHAPSEVETGNGHERRRAEQTHRSSVRRYKRASKTARSGKCLGRVTRCEPPDNCGFLHILPIARRPLGRYFLLFLTLVVIIPPGPRLYL